MAELLYMRMWHFECMQHGRSKRNQDKMIIMDRLGEHMIECPLVCYVQKEDVPYYDTTLDD